MPSSRVPTPLRPVQPETGGGNRTSAVAAKWKSYHLDRQSASRAKSPTSSSPSRDAGPAEGTWPASNHRRHLAAYLSRCLQSMARSGFSIGRSPAAVCCKGRRYLAAGGRWPQGLTATAGTSPPPKNIKYSNVRGAKRRERQSGHIAVRLGDGALEDFPPDPCTYIPAQITGGT